MNAQREAATATAKATLPAVVAAGVVAGYWFAVTDKDKWHPNDVTARQRIRDNAGREWLFRSGGWGNEGKITLGAVSMDEDTCSVIARDCDASASATRDPAAIAKALNSRVCLSPDAQAAHDTAKATLAQQVEQRRKLREHIATLAALGYGTLQNQHDDGDVLPRGKYFNVTLYAPGKPGIDVDYDGHVRFQYAPSTTVENLPALLPLLG